MLNNLENKILWMIGYIDYQPFDFKSTLSNISSYNQIKIFNENIKNEFKLNGKIKDKSLFLVELDNNFYYDLLKDKTSFLKNPYSCAEKNISQIDNFNPSYVIPYAFKTNDLFKDCPLIEKMIKRRELIKDYFVSFLNDVNDNFNPDTYSDVVCLSGNVHIYDYTRPDFIKKNLKGLTLNIVHY